MYNLSTIDKTGKSKIIGLDSKTMTEAHLSAVKYISDDLVFFAILETKSVEAEIEK